MINTVLHGDCLELMKDIADNYIDLTVTSPPYDNLRTYNGSLVWGEHIWKPIIKELYRITKQGGVVVWVVGDATIKGSETGTSFKQALWAKECGFNLHDTMIYLKENPVPLTHNRYEQQFEFMFILAKGKPKSTNLIKTNTKNAGNCVSRKRNKRTYDNDSIRFRDEVTITKKEKIKFNVWSYPIGKSYGEANKHPAIFPLKLAQDHITSWSNEGDIVLDCFGGSGTTAIAAINTNRNYILMEQEQKYIDIINQRITDHTKQLIML